jgi:hypothetical protein
LIRWGVFREGRISRDMKPNLKLRERKKGQKKAERGDLSRKAHNEKVKKRVKIDKMGSF